MENNINFLTFHSGSGGHFLAMKLFLTHGIYNQFRYAGNIEYQKSNNFFEYENVEQGFNNQNLNIENLNDLPLMGSNRFWTGHIEENNIEYAKQVIGQNKIYSLFGIKSYGYHTLLGAIKRSSNGHQNEYIPPENEVDAFINEWKHEKKQEIGIHINWDYIFYNTNQEYINFVGQCFGCDKLVYDDYFLEYTSRSLKLVIDLYPCLKNNKFILGFDNKVLERVL